MVIPNMTSLSLLENRSNQAKAKLERVLRKRDQALADLVRYQGQIGKLAREVERTRKRERAAREAELVLLRRAPPPDGKAAPEGAGATFLEAVDALES
jgi:hypothetical protein